MRFLTAIVLVALAVVAVRADNVMPMVPSDSIELARRAKESFEQGHYSDGAKLYEQILKIHPDNVYALSNLGVVYFRIQKFNEAEVVLKKAIAEGPGDAFSHCTLGIVYFQEKRSDDAIDELNKALAINPNYSYAREFLDVVRNIRNGVKPSKPLPPRLPIGDFDTNHEEEIRGGMGQIGLRPSAGL